VREDAAKSGIVRAKKEKGREFGKDFLLALKTLASSDEKKIL
jgi:hypothetical protein